MKLRVSLKVLSRLWYGGWHYRRETECRAYRTWTRSSTWRDPQPPPQREMRS